MARLDRLTGALLLALAVSACGGSRARPDSDDRYVVFTHNEVTGTVWRIDLADGSGAKVELLPVDALDELHGASALLDRRLVDAHGHALEVVPEPLRAAQLSPGRRFIAAHSEDTIQLAALAELEFRPLVRASSRFGWSHDGAALLVLRDEGDEGVLVEVEVGSGSERVRASLSGVQSITGAADGGWWIRTTDALGEGRHTLQRLAPGSDEPSLIHETPSTHRHRIGDPVPTADGERVVFVSSADNDCLVGDLWIVEVDGEDPRRVTSSSCGYFSPERGVLDPMIAALPSGDVVALAAGRSECKPSLGTNSSSCHGELYVYSGTDGAARRVTGLDMWISSPTYHGSMIVLDAL